MSLPTIWIGILAFIIFMYVLLDGFDLGIGILFIVVPDSEQRDIMLSTIAPVWDGNETWLVFGAATLYSAFPIAYSILLPTLYMPIMIMLAALIFRGVIFEFHAKSKTHRYLWDTIFFLSSVLVALMQGIILGTFVRGYGYVLPVTYSAYHWLTPFSLMTGIAVITGYGLLGATWLIMRTTQELQNKIFIIAQKLLMLVGFFLILVSIWTPLMEHRIMLRWFSNANFIYLMPLPLLALVAGVLNFYLLKRRHEILPFWLSISLFVLGYGGFIISDWPYIVPHALSFEAAASPPSTLKFMLVGVMILLPLLIGYTIYAYSVFRGKVTSAQYHY